MGALFAAAYLGVKTIVVIDLVDSRLELAKTLGATHAFNGKDADLKAKIKAVTGTLSATEGLNGMNMIADL